MQLCKTVTANMNDRRALELHQSFVLASKHKILEPCSHLYMYIAPYSLTICHCGTTCMRERIYIVLLIIPIINSVPLVIFKFCHITPLTKILTIYTNTPSKDQSCQSSIVMEIRSLPPLYYMCTYTHNTYPYRSVNSLQRDYYTGQL